MGARKYLAKLLRREKRKQEGKTSRENRIASGSESQRKGGEGLWENEIVNGSDSAPLIIQNEQDDGRGVRQDEPIESTKESQLFEDLFIDKETLGINVLCAPSHPSRPLVDIVLVHGLKGHPYTTWLDAQSGTYWPVHLLQHDVPNARIMTFGYDADPAGVFVSGQNDIRDHAHTLLGELARERKTDPDRKLVFIAHSLGGLITKKALCMSESSAESHLNQTERSTIAIAFLGTPHRGSGLATFAKGIAGILKLVNVKANGVILEPLERSSQVLADIEDSFSNWLRKKNNQIDLTCFYEELGLPVTGMVVTKDSAQIYGYPQLPIHANHRDMGKFVGPNDSGYKRVIGEIERWLGKLETTPGLTPLDKECLQSLAFPEMNDRGLDINPAADGTCTWILGQKTYLSWLSQGHSLLWIKGKPGAGKSTLLKYVLESLKQHRPLSPDRAITVSFFFHGRGSETQRTPLGLFRSLLHQLLERFPTPLSDVVQTFSTRLENQGMPGEKWSWRPLELQSFLESSLPKVLAISGVRIVVDALDECGEKAATDLVKFFQRLRSKCSSSKNSLDICFSCRHFPLVSLDNGFEIRVEDENHHDIKKYIQGELQGLIEQDKELEVLEDEILSRSSYIFQWVSLVLARALSQYNEGCSLLDILERLRDTPTELYSLYEDILQHLHRSLDKQAQSLQLMQWICFSTRPLSLTELRLAMVSDWNTSYMSQEQFQSSPNFVKDDNKMEKRTKALSGGLAEIKLHADGKRIVQFIHQSVKDYLTEGGLRVLDTFSESMDVTIGRANYRLSRSCIRYFAIVEIYQRMARLVNDWNYVGYQKEDALQEEFPFLRYSLTFWGDHAKLAEERGIPQEDLLYYWYWPSPQFIQSWINACDFVSVYLSNNSLSASTLLHVASAYGLTSVVRAILKELPYTKNTLNSKDGREPLHYAAAGGHVHVAKMLLELGNAEPDPKDFDDQTPLSVAAHNGQEYFVRLLIDNGHVDLNSQDEDGATPLSRAAGQGHENVVRLLLQCEGIDIGLKDDEELSALSRAAEYGHENIVNLLLGHGPTDLAIQDRMAIPCAACGGHYEIVKLLLESSSNFDINYSPGKTALSFATMWGSDSMVNLLLQCPGIDVNCKDEFRRTPLSCAAEEGFDNIVVSLLAFRDIDIGCKDEDGITALAYAAKQGHGNVVRMLLGCEGVDLNAKDSRQRPILANAARFTWKDVVNLLLGSGQVDINSNDRDGRTALSWVAEDGNEDMVERLLQCDNIDVDCPDNTGITALAFASIEGHKGIVDLLLRRGNINIKDNQGMTALMWASKKGEVSVVELLLGCNNIDKTTKDNEGMTALAWASRKGHESTLRLLLQETLLDINAKDGKGMTALAWASRKGRDKVVKALLEEHEIDINSEDNEGATALSWATKGAHENVVELLKSHGAS